MRYYSVLPSVPLRSGRRNFYFLACPVRKFIWTSRTSQLNTRKMLLSRRAITPAALSIDSAACILCQWRSFSSTYRRPQEKEAPSTRPVPAALQDAPRAHGKTVKEFTPKSLDRPIGMPNPPKSIDNFNIDMRTLKQRRDDFVDYEKHIARRKEL